MRRKLALALILLVAAIAAAAWSISSHGFSARAEPSAAEALIARFLRRLAMPRDAAGASNPVAPSPEVMSEAMAHFADHCASCHANDGSGGTDFGLGLYPPPSDLRKNDTQKLSDGELFYIIHNGIRFTGMPAFGDEDPAKDMDSWKLVHFIRHLPDLTVDEIDAMKKMNPRSPMQIQHEEEMRRLIEGGKPEDHPHTHQQ